MIWTHIEYTHTSGAKDKDGNGSGVAGTIGALYSIAARGTAMAVATGI